MILLETLELGQASSFPMLVAPSIDGDEDDENNDKDGLSQFNDRHNPGDDDDASSQEGDFPTNCVWNG